MRRCPIPAKQQVAYIPDEAIDEMSKLTAGAWRLYCFLARCRNQSTGKCCPSVNLTMESIGINRGTVYTLRKELQTKSWATFNGNSVTDLFGFKSPKNQTKAESEKSDSPKIQTAIEDNKELRPNPSMAESEKSDSPNIQTSNAESKELTKSPKIQTNLDQSEKSDFLSENSDCHIGRTSKENQQIKIQGANAPIVADNPPDTKTVIWRKGVSLLREGGVPESSARTLLGKLAKDYGDEPLARAIETVEGANPANPKAYLIKVLQNIQKGVKGSEYAEERDRRARRDLARFRTDWKAKWRSQHGGGAKMG